MADRRQTTWREKKKNRKKKENKQRRKTTSTRERGKKQKRKANLLFSVYGKASLTQVDRQRETESESAWTRLWKSESNTSERERLISSEWTLNEKEPHSHKLLPFYLFLFFFSTSLRHEPPPTPHQPQPAGWLAV